MKTKKIALFDAKSYDREHFDLINKKYGYEIKYFEVKLSADTAALADGYDIVCCFVNDVLNAGVIDLLIKSGVKLVALRCAGYNNVDLEASFGRLHVVRVPAYSPFAVAEYTAALMLTLNRKTHRAYSRVRDNNFSIGGFTGFDLNGKTAGVIGTGKIGKIFIRILKGFGVNVLAYDAFPDRASETDLGFRYTDLDEIYRSADVVSLHCPLTPETYHLLNKDSFEKMKQGVMILNTGRGGLIDTKALIDSLKEKKIGSAGLDVYEEESQYFFEDFSAAGVTDDLLARLLTFPNVLVTSHQAFLTEEALNNIAETTLENIKAYQAGEPLRNEICYQCHDGCVKKEKGRCF